MTTGSRVGRRRAFAMQPARLAVDPRAAHQVVVHVEHAPAIGAPARQHAPRDQVAIRDRVAQRRIVTREVRRACGIRVVEAVVAVLAHVAFRGSTGRSRAIRYARAAAGDRGRGRAPRRHRCRHRVDPLRFREMIAAADRAERCRVRVIREPGGRKRAAASLHRAWRRSSRAGSRASTH